MALAEAELCGDRGDTTESHCNKGWGRPAIWGLSSALNHDASDTSQPCRGDSPCPWDMLGFHVPLGGYRVALTSLISPVMQKYSRDSVPEDLHPQPPQRRAWLSLGHAWTLCEKPCEGLPPEPPTSRTEMWASAAPSHAPGGQVASRAPALSRRHQSPSHVHPFQPAQRAHGLAQR